VFSRSKSINVVFVPLYKTIPGVQKQLAKVKSRGSAAKINVVRKKKITKSNIAKQVVKAQVEKIVKKIKPKPKPVVKKTNLKLKQQAVKMKPKPVVKEKPQQVVAKKTTAVKAVSKPVEAVTVPEPIFVGRKDLKNLQMAKDIETVVAKYWHPPIGFAKDTECTVQVTVNSQGRSSGFSIVKSSKVLAYDMSVRQSVPQIIYPQSVRNKTLTIVFKQ
jgi:hypothetical protein